VKSDKYQRGGVVTGTSEQLQRSTVLYSFLFIYLKTKKSNKYSNKKCNPRNSQQRCSAVVKVTLLLEISRGFLRRTNQITRCANGESLWRNHLVVIEGKRSTFENKPNLFLCSRECTVNINKLSVAFVYVEL